MKTGEMVVPPPVGCTDKKRVVVIGGGVSGVLTAFELARSGHSVTLVEMGGLGNGSSQRSAACIRQQFDTLATVRGMVFATRFFEDWSAITKMGDNPLVQNGYLFLYDWRQDQKVINRRVDMQRSVGLHDVEFLSPEQVDAKFPYVSTVGTICATWCPTDGFLLPNVVYNDGAEAARKLGVEVLQHCRVVDVVTEGSKISAVYVMKNGEKQMIPGDLFVNATGAWGGKVSELLGGMGLPIKAWRRYLYIVKMPSETLKMMTSEDFKCCPMVIGPNGAYSHPTPSGELMMGWLHHAEAEDPDTADLEHLEFGFSINGYGEAMLREVARWLPEAADRRVSSGSCGFYEMMPDHNPVIDFDVKKSNMVHAVGFSGHGLMHAPFTARAVAELVASGKTLFHISLPWDIGEVDMRVYHATRDFYANHESMHI